MIISNESLVARRELREYCAKLNAPSSVESAAWLIAQQKLQAGESYGEAIYAAACKVDALWSGHKRGHYITSGTL